MTRYIKIVTAINRILLNQIPTIRTDLSLISSRLNHTAVSKTDYQPQTPEHIKSIVDQIAQLKFYEVTLLNECLRKTLNIPEVSLGASPTAASGASRSDEEEEAAQASSVKASFTVKLAKFEDSKKVSLIKEIKKLIEGINLVEAKRFVEDCPKVVRANISKDEAEALKKQLEDAGGQVVIE